MKVTEGPVMTKDKLYFSEGNGQRAVMQSDVTGVRHLLISISISTDWCAHCILWMKTQYDH